MFKKLKKRNMIEEQVFLHIPLNLTLLFKKSKGLKLSKKFLGAVFS
jgi:hypothetical protein